MGLARKLRKLRRRTEEVFKKKRRKALLEPLEPRLLLSADLKFTMTGDATDLTLRLRDVSGTDTLELVNNDDVSILQSQALADTSAVIIEGSDQSDEFTVDFTTPFSLPVSFTDVSATDSDTLKVTGGARAWTINGKNSGKVAEVNFAGIENLAGGLGADTFIFSRVGTTVGEITGQITDQSGPVQNTGVEEAGRVGDAIQVDLKAETGANLFEWVYASGNVDLPPFGRLVKTQHDFEHTGVLYFLPDVDLALTTNADDGIKVPVIIDGQLSNFTIYLERWGTDVPFSAIETPWFKDNAVPQDKGTTAQEEELFAYRVQQRLRLFGFPDQSGNTIEVTGQLDSATKYALGLFNATVTPPHTLPEGYASNPMVEEPDYTAINSMWAPFWLELTDQKTDLQNLDNDNGFLLFPGPGDGEQPDRWLTDWTRDVLLVAGNLWLDQVKVLKNADPDIKTYLETRGPVGLVGLWQNLVLQSASPKQGGPIENEFVSVID
ncbi:MAG: LEPR-XLL domain-containing protein, partial [Desulfobacteraceae bacterium]